MAYTPSTQPDDPRSNGAGEGAWSLGGRLLLAALYLVAGMAHLAMPEPFLRITPDWVPAPALVIAATGVAEIAGAAGLMIPRLRAAAGIGLALYAVAVFPANIQHAVTDLGHGTGLPWAYHAPRLYAQPFIMAWALWAGGVWPRPRR